MSQHVISRGEPNTEMARAESKSGHQSAERGRLLDLLDERLRFESLLARLSATFATAEEFLEAPEQPAPGCLVLDFHLPGLSGLELQEQLNIGGRTVPIVFITAYGDERVREQALRAGALAFLQKPFEEHSLLDAVERAVS